MTRSPRRWPGYYLVVVLLTAAVFISYIDRTTISVSAIAMQAQLGWSETDKGLVLSAFYAGYILLMLVSSALANRYGGWLVLGLAVIWWSLITALTPPAALVSLPSLIAMRIALGLGEAAVFPASFNMIGRWVPPLQRTRAVALLASAVPLSTVFALPMTGWLVHGFGWPAPFYVFGAMGLVWALIWFTRVSGGNGPEESAASVARVAIPWRRILRLPAVWVIVFNHFCYNWSSYVLLAWLPSYLKSTFGVSLVNAGVYSAAPWLASFMTANAAGHVADRLLRAGHSATFVRKLMQCTGLGLGGVFLLMLPSAASLSAAVAIMCCAAAALALCYSGFTANCFDVAPRHAEIIYGISNTVATLPGIFGVYLTGWLVDRTGTFAVPFYLTSAIAMLGALMYLALASGERCID